MMSVRGTVKWGLRQLGLLAYVSALLHIWRSQRSEAPPDSGAIEGSTSTAHESDAVSQPVGGAADETVVPHVISVVPAEDRFDFLFVLAGRAGSLAAQNILAAHPDLVVVPRLTLDAAMSNWSGMSLASMHNEFLPIIRHCRQAGKKTCLVVHRVDYLRHPNVIQDLSRIVSPDGLILIVRHPTKALLSENNHNLFHQFGYHFASNKLFWFAEQYGQQPIDLPLDTRIDIPVDCPYDRAIDLNALTPPMDICVRYFDLFNDLSEHFTGRKRVVDADVLVGARISELYRLAGVSDRLPVSDIDRVHAGRTDRYMSYNAIDAKLFGETILRFRLFTGGAGRYDHDQSRPGSVAEYFPVASIQVTEAHRAACSLPLPERMDLGVHVGGHDWGAPWREKASMWFERPLYERRFLENAGYLEALLDALIRQWVVNVSKSEQALAPYKLDAPSEALRQASRKLFDEDTRHLVALYPDQLGHWSSN